MNLYTVLVRSLLECCIQVWSSYKQKYINLLKRVQNMTTRFRGDMIQTYKIVIHTEYIDPAKFFRMRTESGVPELHRGHIMFRKRNKQKQRDNYFMQGVMFPYSDLEEKRFRHYKQMVLNQIIDKNEKDSEEEIEQIRGYQAL
ncbi:unnamed protein product [Meganyctiphanes norvegica]|uniref:Uncharacterized protein n=1 Tax=Meganyctiphanes norvegica TaxID=48144 RepID=A0AAV2SXU7_MEGNR